MSKTLVCGELGDPARAGAGAVGRLHGAGLGRAVIAVANAEVLAGLCASTSSRYPGAPFVYGVGVGIINMRTTVEAYCNPESSLGHQAMVDLARHYGLPSWSYAGDSDAKTLDEQWSSEADGVDDLRRVSRARPCCTTSATSSRACRASYDSLVLGDELAGFVRGLHGRPRVDDESLQLDAIVAAGPGGNHLGTQAHAAPLPRLLAAGPVRPEHARALARRRRDDARRARARADARAARFTATLRRFPTASRRALDAIVAEAQRAATGG